MKYISKTWLFRGVLERVKLFGFFKVVHECYKYYKKYSRYPKKFGPFRVSWKYKLNCIGYYIKYVYYLSNYSFDFIINCPPLTINLFLKYKWDHNPSAFQLFDKAISYNICKLNSIAVPEIYIIKRNNKITYKCNFNGKCICKPINSSQGDNVTIMDNSLRGLDKVDNVICQEIIKPHSKLIKLSATDALSTLRIHGYRDMFNKVSIIAAYLRLPINEIVDNMGRGGIGIPIDLDSGELKKYGTKEFPRLERITRHPVTNIEFKGYKLPLWEEAINFVNNLHSIFSYKFVAWDIAVTEEMPVFIEGNPPGDWCVPQLLGDTPMFSTLPFQMHIKGNHRKYLKYYEK